MSDVRTFPIDQIDPNPFPMWTMDSAYVAELAQEIGEHGWNDVLSGRLVDGRVQLRAGAHRLAALKVLAQTREEFREIGVLVAEYTDQQMQDGALIENYWRREPNPLETARAMRHYIETRGVTQQEAAPLFHLKTAAAVANVLALLDLPPRIQELTELGQIPQRDARVLRVVARLDLKGAVKIAEQSVKEGDSETFLHDAIGDLLERKGEDLRGVWDLAWPKKPFRLGLAIDLGEGERLTDLPACKGCEWHVTHDGDYCGRKACYDAKLRLFAEVEAERIAVAKTIPLAGAQEKVVAVFNGNSKQDSDWKYQKSVERVIGARRPELRIVAYVPGANDRGYERKRMLGSEFVQLVTVDPKATHEWMDAKDADERKEVADQKKENKTPAETKKRVAQEKKAAEQSRAERSAALRQKYETLWLIEQGARTIAEQMEISGGILRFAEELFLSKYTRMNYQGLTEFKGANAAIAAAVKMGDVAREEDLRRRHIAIAVIADRVLNYQGHYERSFTEVCDEIEDICSAAEPADEDVEHFDVKLPKGWNDVPVLRTAFNCWQCGGFGSREGSLTKGELAAGWIVAVEGEPGHESRVGDLCFCSQKHADEWLREQRKAKQKG